MEVLLGLVMVLGAVFFALAMLRLLKDIFVKKNSSIAYFDIAAAKEQARDETSQWSKHEKEELVTRLHAEIAKQRTDAIAEIESWSLEEKKRLTAQFTKDYEADKARARNEMNAKSDADIAAAKEQARVEVDQWSKHEKEELVTRLHAEIAKQRTDAIAEIESWSSEEKKRLTARYTKDYEAEIARVRNEMNAKIETEIDSIRKLFAEFSTEEKRIAEEDIKRFIMKKISPSD